MSIAESGSFRSANRCLDRRPAGPDRIRIEAGHPIDAGVRDEDAIVVAGAKDVAKLLRNVDATLVVDFLLECAAKPLVPSTALLYHTELI